MSKDNLQQAYDQLLLQFETLKADTHDIIQKFEEIQDIADIGFWNWGLETGDYSWSSKMYELFNIELGRNDFSQAELNKNIHPEDIPRIDHALKNAIEGKEDYDLIFRVIDQDITIVRYVHSKAKVVFDESGNPLELLGTTQDVTHLFDKIDEFKKIA